MGRRRRQILMPDDQHELLNALGECRQACIRAKTKADIFSPVYDVCSGLIAAIDDVAAVLTGDRRHFWLKAAPSPPLASPRKPDE